MCCYWPRRSTLLTVSTIYLSMTSVSGNPDYLLGIDSLCHGYHTWQMFDVRMYSVLLTAVHMSLSALVLNILFKFSDDFLNLGARYHAAFKYKGILCLVSKLPQSFGQSNQCSFDWSTAIVQKLLPVLCTMNYPTENASKSTWWISTMHMCTGRHLPYFVQLNATICGVISFNVSTLISKLPSRCNLKKTIYSSAFLSLYSKFTVWLPRSADHQSKCKC